MARSLRIALLLFGLVACAVAQEPGDDSPVLSADPKDAVTATSGQTDPKIATTDKEQASLDNLIQNAPKATVPAADVPVTTVAQCAKRSAARVGIEAPTLLCSQIFADAERNVLNPTDFKPEDPCMPQIAADNLAKKTFAEQANGLITAVKGLYDATNGFKLANTRWIARKDVAKRLVSLGAITRADGQKYSLDDCPGPLCWDQSVCLLPEEAQEMAQQTVLIGVVKTWDDQKPGGFAQLNAGHTQPPNGNKNFPSVCSTTYQNPETCPWMRPAHSKSPGCLQGVLVVNPNLPTCLRQGVFRTPGKQYPIHVRLSNSDGPMSAARRDMVLQNWCASDRLPNSRGFAVKVMGWRPDGNAGGDLGEFSSTKVDSFYPHNTVDFHFLLAKLHSLNVPVDRLFFHLGTLQATQELRINDSTCFDILGKIKEAVFADEGRFAALLGPAGAAQDAAKAAALNVLNGIAPSSAFQKLMVQQAAMAKEPFAKFVQGYLSDSLKLAMTDPFQEEWFSQSTYGFGRPADSAGKSLPDQYFPAKFKLEPCKPRAAADFTKRYAEIAKGNAGNWFDGAIAQQVADRLAASGACMAMKVQFWDADAVNAQGKKDAVDDDVEWQSQYQKDPIAYLLFPKGSKLIRKDPDTLCHDCVLGDGFRVVGAASGAAAVTLALRRNYMKECDMFQWAPWNHIDAHRPLGWTMGLRRIVYPAVFRDRQFRSNPTESKVTIASVGGEDRISRDIDSTEWAGFKLGGGLKWNGPTSEVTFADGTKINVAELFNAGDPAITALGDAKGLLKPLDAATRTAEIANAKTNAVASTTLVGRSSAREGELNSDNSTGTPAWVWVILVIGVLIAVALAIVGIAVIMRARANLALAAAQAQKSTLSAETQTRQNPYVRRASRRSRTNVKH